MKTMPTGVPTDQSDGGSGLAEAPFPDDYSCVMQTKTKEHIRQLQTLPPQLASAMVLTTATEKQTRTDDYGDLILESRILSQTKRGTSGPQDSIFLNLVPLNW